MPEVDIDRETARAAAAEELANPIYPKASLSDRISRWLNDLLNRIVDSGSALPGGWLTIVVLALLVLAALIAAARVARRALGGRVGERLYDGRVLAAAEHRIRAEQSAARGAWATAIRQRVRAIGRQLEEGGVVNPVAGRTATELACEAGRALPGFGDELNSAATVFNDVTYGQLPGTEDEYRRISDLDDRLCSHITVSDESVLQARSR